MSAMNGTNGTTYMMIPSAAPVDAAEIERDDADIAEVLFSWGDAGARSVLAATHLAKGATLRAGEVEGCELFIPAEILGAAHAELVTFDGARATVTRPHGVNASVVIDGLLTEGASVEVGRGQVAELHVGEFRVRVSVSAAARRPAASLADSVRQSALGGVGASAFFHAALFASVALFMPALGENDAEAMERDQILMMQRYLNASAESERERLEAENGGMPAQENLEPTPSGGQRASGAEGAMGKPTNTSKGHWSLKGDAKASEVSLPREQELAMAAGFGMIGVLAAASPVDARMPTVPWESVLNGSDRESHAGDMWSSNIGDAFGSGLGLSGYEEGGGGKGKGIGTLENGDIGRGIGGLPGPGGGPGGFGGCGPGRPCGPGVGGTHVARPPRMRPEPMTQTNGRLPAEVIQRIVRLNQGRMLNCYQSALTRNPSLEGRVAVKFVIDRSGGVSTALDGGSDIPDEGVKACVVKTFFTLTFPAPTEGTVSVVYPIFFTPSS